jgi:hypothetical protein
MALGLTSSITENIRLTNEQIEAVNYMLNRYQTSRGDTYYINIGLNQNYTSLIHIFVEFTSNSQYIFWAYSSFS